MDPYLSQLMSDKNKKKYYITNRMRDKFMQCAVCRENRVGACIDVESFYVCLKCIEKCTTQCEEIYAENTRQCRRMPILQSSDELSDSNILDILDYGHFYFPAWLHYDDNMVSVSCDRCKKQCIEMCIGFKSKDLCMTCAHEISELHVYKNPEPYPPVTKMGQSIYYTQTKMAQSMFLTKCFDFITKKK